MTLQWQQYTFSQLTTDQLFDILLLRVNVFVVEQQCPYPELDAKDRHRETVHFIGTTNDGQIATYCRILAPGQSYPQASLGRIVVAKPYRGQQLGQPLVQKALDIALTTWPHSGVQIGAQHALETFYQTLGFKAASAMYLEDDIPHIDMIYCDENIEV
ncbi:GNAT family N-acetyltransferase [Shewanella intestini]|uniref:GNAT family N-acetyltransferase n=1 Tax=Shewanella intestini TaxID=2017544 RepID=A0ABS5I0K3_9GAMM|nr:MULTISPECIES: GNAT family N-acetyltransferase [Shewanella]MBR9727558.1 GNAT family N-acetyltransferase [Shewanella intestini]MRG35292.1 GNAT family N-acetyltransferase [Shewanella sp. XMDDZSB0408]